MTEKCGICGLERPFCEECAPEAEREAAKLWRLENPNMSVFACTLDIQNEYRRRISAKKAAA